MPPRKKAPGTPAAGTADDPIVHRHEHTRPKGIPSELEETREELRIATRALDIARPDTHTTRNVVWATAKHLHMSVSGSPSRDQAAIAGQALALAHTEEEKELALTMLARLGGKEAEEGAPLG